MKYLILLASLFSSNFLAADFTSKCIRFYDNYERGNRTILPEDNIFVHLNELYKPERRDSQPGTMGLVKKWGTFSSEDKCKRIKKFVKTATQLDFARTTSPLRISSIAPLSKAESLSSLNLEGHRVQDLTPLLKATSLRSLNVRNNQIDADAIVILGQFTSLVDLNVSNNPIGRNLFHLPPSLKNFIAAGCGVRSVSKQLFEAKGLITIDLSNNDIAHFRTYIFTLPNLVEVDLSGNKIESIDLYEGRNFKVNLTGNPLKLEPINYQSNQIIPPSSFTAREDLSDDFVAEVDLSDDGVARALKFKYIGSLSLYANRLAKAGEVDLLKKFLNGFKGNKRLLFDPDQSKVADTIDYIMEALRDGRPGEWTQILQIISENMNVNRFIGLRKDLFLFAANTPILPALKVFLFYLDDLNLLKQVQPSVNNVNSLPVIANAITGVKRTEFLDRDDVEIATLLQKTEQTVTDPELRILIQNVCRSLGDAKRKINACNQNIANLEEMVLTGSSNKVFLTPEEESRLSAGDGKALVFYFELQGRIITYFDVAALITTGAIPFNYNASTVTSAMSVTAKVLNQTASLVPVFSAVGKAIALPFHLAKLYSDEADKRKAKIDFIARASIGNKNLLQHLAIAKKYAMSITDQLVRRGRILEAVKDADLAFSFFEANLAIFGMATSNWDELDLAKEIGKKTALDIETYRTVDKKSWKEKFKEHTFSSLVARGIKTLDREDLALVTEKISDVILEFKPNE